MNPVATKGQEFFVKYSDSKKAKPKRFVAFGDQAYINTPQAGWSARCAQIKLANGELVPGIVELCDQDSGEHYGTGIMMADGTIAWQGDNGFLDRLGLSNKEVFPYKYKYAGSIDCDHHTLESGWSR